MNTYRIAFGAAACVLVLMTTGLFPAAVPPGAEKVDYSLLQKTRQEGVFEFLVLLREQADLSVARAVPLKAEKGLLVHRLLTGLAARTQAPLLKLIEENGGSHRAFWIVNLVWVQGDAALLFKLAARPEVAGILDNPTIFQELPRSEDSRDTSRQPADLAWNLDRIGVPETWASGALGQGVVIGGIDTGYAWQHPALKPSYRGWDGSQADHDYNWHDAVHGGGGGNCGHDSEQPCDDYGHGTHTMGIMTGDGGPGNQIGVAPEARWIGCRCMNQGFGTPAMYIECLQWMLAPTDLAGRNADPARAPHVINNSWSCTYGEGCSDPNVLKGAIEALRAAGIVVVVAAGNLGSACATVREPPSIYEASFTVGSTTFQDGASSFSGRGPVTADGSQRLKPDLAAPGSDIRSAYPGDSYQFMSGTSMAAPHVAGAVALLISASPGLAGDPDQLESILRSTAQPMFTSQDCGGIPGQQTPNHTFGHGRVDVWAAVQSVTKIQGDLNSDRLCDSADLVLLQDYLAENIVHGQAGFTADLEQADLNGDGRVDAGDLLLLRRKITPGD